MIDAAPHRSAWQRFWDRGGWWRALLLAAVYYGLYQLLSLALLPLAAQVDDPASAAGVLVYDVLPILVGGLLLVAFIASLGWWRPVFGAPAHPGSGVDVDRDHRGPAVQRPPFPHDRGRQRRT
ncbi:hypothetical protein AB1285_21075 [Microbacterium sp. NRRL B-14842]|uniref:hypothetical protein n=1 Tax=Microbacterium sp. NRRL B-14842 TaxID=3162881 RepID=UPI003D2D2051